MLDIIQQVVELAFGRPREAGRGGERFERGEQRGPPRCRVGCFGRLHSSIAVHIRCRHGLGRRGGELELRPRGRSSEQRVPWRHVSSVGRITR